MGHTPALLDGLTSQQRAFIRHSVAGLNPTAAAREAGYAAPEAEGSKLAHHPRLIAAIARERQRVVDVELAPIALNTLRALMTDPETPAHVRHQAAKTTLTAAGMLHKRAQDQGVTRASDKPISRMSAVEMMAAMRAYLDRMERPAQTIEGDASQVSEVAEHDPADGEYSGDEVLTGDDAE